MTNPNPVGKISWTDLIVPDAEGVRKFYEAVVGWNHSAFDMGGYEAIKARNPKIRDGQSGHLDCAFALETILEVPEGEISRAQPPKIRLIKARPKPISDQPNARPTKVAHRVARL